MSRFQLPSILGVEQANRESETYMGNTSLVEYEQSWRSGIEVCKDL